MKKLLILATAIVAVVGCSKTKLDNDKPEFDDQILVGSGVIVAGDTKVDPTPPMDAFGPTSAISVWSFKLADFKALDAATAATTQPSDVDQAQVGYRYGKNFWSPITATYLKWINPNPSSTDGSEPLALVGLHPADATIITGVTEYVANYATKTVQNTPAELALADVMWAAHTGLASTVAENLTPSVAVNKAALGEGISKSATTGPVDLQFHHLTSALNLTVRFTKQVVTGEDYTNVAVTGVRIVGTDVPVEAKINLWDGILVPTPNAVSTEGSVSWTPATAVTLTDDLILTTDEATAQDPKVYTELTKILTIPTTYVLANNNRLEFDVTFDYTKPLGTPVATTRTYSYVLGDTGFTTFERNKMNLLKAAISLNSDQIQITASIVDWETGIDEEIIPR